MSKCITCKYALYDGMCMAMGKFTVLDSDSCELYRPTQEYEIARLKREYERLHEIVARLSRIVEPYLLALVSDGIDLEVDV